MSSHDLLMIFVKRPEAGRVKTRLASDIGDKKALELYLETLSLTRQAVESQTATIQVWSDRPLQEDRIWNHPRYEKRIQPDGDLGNRLRTAFQEGFESGFKRVVVIGSDCPDLTSSHIVRAFDMLRKFDIVIGPAVDGGYYLLGLNRYTPWIFENMPWSQSSLKEKTVQAILNHGMNYRLLPELNDIDTVEDLKKTSLYEQLTKMDE